MKIEVAKHSGFCFGVKRAIDIAREVASTHDEKTYVYGQLVHNERVLSDLENEGIIFANSISEIPNGATTVLRAHGEPGTTYTSLEKKNVTKSLHDATCPLVMLVHTIARKLKDAGYEVAIYGKRDHPETIGTSYHLGGIDNVYVIEKPAYAQQFHDHVIEKKWEKVALISQTTMSVGGYKELVEKLNTLGKQWDEIPMSVAKTDIAYGYVDTICNPTKQRQSGTEELAARADIMVVIGGVHSSNSKELAAKCKALGVETYYVQEASQVNKDWFSGKELVGVTAGASTPDTLIEEVVEKIKEFDQ